MKITHKEFGNLHIKVDEHQFIVVRTTTIKENYSKKSGKRIGKPINPANIGKLKTDNEGYFRDLDNAVNYIIKSRISESHETLELDEYIRELTRFKSEFNDLSKQIMYGLKEIQETKGLLANERQTIKKQLIKSRK